MILALQKDYAIVPVPSTTGEAKLPPHSHLGGRDVEACDAELLLYMFIQESLHEYTGLPQSPILILQAIAVPRVFRRLAGFQGSPSANCMSLMMSFKVLKEVELLGVTNPKGYGHSICFFWN